MSFMERIFMNMRENINPMLTINWTRFLLLFELPFIAFFTFVFCKFYNTENIDIFFDNGIINYYFFNVY